MKMSRHISKNSWGLILIFLGVSAWIPYGVLKYLMGQEVALYPFLAAHLLGVIPGSWLRGGGILRRWIIRR